MSIRSDETNARAAEALRGKPKRRVGRKPTSGNGKLPAWYLRPDGSKPERKP